MINKLDDTRAVPDYKVVKKINEIIDHLNKQNPASESKAEKATPLPCPFCGVEAIVSGSGYSWRVGCVNEDCEIICETVSYPSRETAIEAWNRRAKA